MKHLSILVPDEQTTLSTVASIIGAYQVFSEANNYIAKNGGQPVFDIALAGASKSHFLHNHIVTITHQFAIHEIKKTDLILVPASLIRSYELASPQNKLLLDWISQQYKQGAEVASMCSGGFSLAAAGILEGKTCSTHWAMADSFRALYPGINLQTDQLVTDEHGIYTNGGAYSFLHLLLYLVEKFYGRQAAIYCAKYFQIDLDRNLQAEFVIFTGHKKHDDTDILEAQKFIEAHYPEKISIEKLAGNLNIGRRNFDRRFIKATGLTPLDYIQRVRTEAAKKQFETSRKQVNEVMYEVGYSDSKAFREVFSRVTGLSPLAYKEKYNKG